MFPQRLPPSPKRAAALGPRAAQLASWGIMLVSFATILGCLAMPWIADRLGRRGALAIFFTLMMVFIALTFGKVFYLGADRSSLVFPLSVLSRFGGGQLRRLYSLATRAISHGMPRQRLLRFPPHSPDLAGLESRFWWERASGISARLEFRLRSRSSFCSWDYS